MSLHILDFADLSCYGVVYHVPLFPMFPKLIVRSRSLIRSDSGFIFWQEYFMGSITYFLFYHISRHNVCLSLFVILRLISKFFSAPHTTLHSTWDLSSLTRVRTCNPSIGSSES